MSQNQPVYNFVAAPYPAPIVNTLAEDSIPPDSLLRIVQLARPGQSDVYTAFLRNGFYLFFDLNGLKRVYLVEYQDCWEAYAGELSLNGIPETRLTATELVNCVLKYHSGQ